ncbi:hypothetical protein GQ54DRAFT_65761 [Martensiomyces pterosporus]|nr:hypothetical protein GQ54DRAFT_65761 [Martensiomyces pterosporus]
MLTKRSVWTAGAASGKPGCRVPLFPVLHTLACDSMVYNFRDFVSRIQGHNSLVSLCVSNELVYFDFDAELFKSLKTVVFDANVWNSEEEIAGSVDLYKSAFTSLLRAKTNIQRMSFTMHECDTLFQVPPDIGCANLRSLCLGVEIEFKSMLRLLSNLKHLVELELNIDDEYINNVNDGPEDTDEYIDEPQPPQAEYQPVSSTLRRFTCLLYSPKERRCYTTAYAFELALHLPTLESMTLGVAYEADVVFYEALLGMLLQVMSGSPYMNDGILNAKVVPHSSLW